MSNQRTLRLGAFIVIVVAHEASGAAVSRSQGGYRARFTISRTDRLPLRGSHTSMVSNLLPYIGELPTSVQDALDLGEAAALAEIEELETLDATEATA